MRIDKSVGYAIDQGFDRINTQDPFDLRLTINELRNEHRGMAPVMSISLCTPGCGNNGTGNSFCCTCK